MVEQEVHARRRRGRWIRLGTAALVVLGIAAVLWANRGPIRARLARGPEYRAAFPSVSGLRPGDEVRYGGLAVGRVRSIRIAPDDPSRIVVAFRVDEGTPVRRNTRAAIIDATDPVTRYLSLRTDSPPAPPLAAGAMLESEANPTLEETLLRVTAVLERADTLLTAAAPVLDATFFAALARTTERLDRTMAVVASSAARLQPSLERTVTHLDDVVVRTDRILAVADSATPELRSAATEAARALQETRGMLGDLRGGAAQGGGLAQLMRDLTLTSDNLARLTARLERSPASLLQRRAVARKTAGPPLAE